MSDIDALGTYPFDRLRQLLQDIPSEQESFNLTVGEPKTTTPDFVAETIARNAQDWNRYPPIPGSPELRAAVHGWLCKRFSLDQNTDFTAEPTCGSREGLFLLAMLTRFDAKSNQTPKRRNIIAMPNPGYAVYAGSARIAGAETLALDTVAGQFPTPDSLDEATLQDLRLIYLCSPDNPSGKILPESSVLAWIKAGRKYDFIVAGDECYSELYANTPPTGILQIAAKTGSYDQVVCLNSLSKRSSSAGLRSGLLAGDPKIMTMIGKIKAYAGNRMPIALQQTSIALWQDEDHVAPIRKHYQDNYRLVNNIFHDYPTYDPISAGMFLWLNVGNDLETTKLLWVKGGLRVLPGQYLCEPSQITPGENFIRIALVHHHSILEPALTTMRQLLS